MDIVETIDQVGNGGLPCSCRADKGHFLPLVCVEVDIVEDLVLIIVGEVYICKDDISDQFDQFVVAIFPRVFPSPEVGLLISDDHATIDLFIVDQGDSPFIHFDFFIQEIKDPISPSKCHKDKVQLLRYLGDRPVKGTVELEEGHKSTNGEPTDTIQGEDPSDQWGQDKGDISQVPQYRHQDIGIAVGLVGRFKELVIDPLKGFNALFFMNEGLDHLLTRHHLFDKAVFNP